MLAEALDADVPTGLVVLDEEAFGHGDPERYDDEVPTTKVLDAKILGTLNRAGVFSDPSVEVW